MSVEQTIYLAQIVTEFRKLNTTLSLLVDLLAERLPKTQQSLLATQPKPANIPAAEFEKATKA
jgi:hypothetical protein